MSEHRNIQLTAGTAVTIIGAGTDFTLQITTAGTFTNRGILISSGNSGFQALAALNSGELIVGSSTALEPQILPLSASSQGYVLTTNSASRFGLSWVSTGNLGSASSVVYAATGNDYVVMNLAADLTNEYRLVQSGNSITVTTATGLITINATTQNITGKQDSVTFPLIVGSGGTGQTTLTNRGLTIGSGTTAIESLAALNSGELVVGSSTLVAPQILPLSAGSQGYVLSTNSSSRFGLAWVSTGNLGSASSVVYAATGNTYVTMSAAGDLTAERILTAGMGINLADGGAGGNATLTSDTGLLVTSGRTISTLYPVSGGGDLSVNRTHAVDTAFLINSGRTLSATYPLAGGGNLSADRTLTADTAFLINSGRTISTTYPLAGGGDFSANRTFTVDSAFFINTGRTLSTIYPLSGGGDLSLNRTHAVDTAFLVNTGRVLTAGSGLTGGGDLSADRTFTINNNVRQKGLGFFAAGNLSTAMFVEEVRIYIPFNMETSGVWLAATTGPTGASLIINPKQYNSALTSSTAIFLSANRPTIPAAAVAGSSFTTAISTLFAGSWLGFDIDQVGSTNAGSNMTVTFMLTTS